MGSHDEDLEDELRPAKDFLEQPALADRVAEDLQRVAEVVDVRVLFLELAHYEARVGRENAHEDEEDDAGNETDGGDHGRKRKDTKRYSLGYQDNTSLPVQG